MPRDRERGVPRYNDFREKLRKRRFTRWEDMTSQPAVAGRAAGDLRRDIDAVDLQVGLLAEQPAGRRRLQRHPRSGTSS